MRAFTVPQKKKKWKGPSPPKISTIPDRILVFDTETRTDIYQNFLFGYFELYENGKLKQDGLFYDSKIITKKEEDILKTFAIDNNINTYTLEEFREVFLDEVYDLETLCIGFNLPFDISRIALQAPQGRLSYREGFSMQISENQYYPRLIVNKQTNTMSFINWAKPLNKEQKRFRGHFLDLRMTCHALTDRKYSLSSACEAFNTEYKKQKVKEHGKIYGPEYIAYCIADVKATYSLYQETKKEFDTYKLDIPITKAYTPASIGKEILKKIKVKSFGEKNADFPPEITGHIMNAYFGGRTECKIRKTPIESDLIDFLSMYPTVCTLQGLWKFVIAEKIEYEDATDELRDFVDSFELEDIQDKESWKKLQGIVQVRPSDDILPVRAKYSDEKIVWNIGVNRLTSKAPLWYSIADVIASKLYTGKTPEIVQAIKFTPKSVEKGLKKTEIHGAKIDPYKEDLFKRLIEYRQELKDKRDTFDEDTPEYDTHERNQNVIKIITNSISYGIFVQIDVEESSKPSTVNVYGLESFKNEKSKREKPGFMFNPIIAVSITSAARLLLAATEVFLSRKGTTHAYCDTDSMVVPTQYRKQVQEFFQKLNPYDFKSKEKIDVFKLEKGNVLFYGISAKRYCLYTIDDKTGEIKIDKKKYSSHGLGYLLDPFAKTEDDLEKDWSPKVWKDILDFHYKKITRKQLQEKYEGTYAIAQISVSKPRIRNRLKKLDKSKDYYKQIKPFNFCLVGFSTTDNKKTKELIKPLAPFRRPVRDAVFDAFVDLNSKNGAVLKGQHYWKDMWSTIRRYMNNPESKFDGDDGVLERKHINVISIKHIGKEADDIDLVPVLGANLDTFVIYEDENAINADFEANADEILKLEPREVKKYNLSRSSLKFIKEKIERKEFDRIMKTTKNRLLAALREKQNKQKNVAVNFVKSKL